MELYDILTGTKQGCAALGDYPQRIVSRRNLLTELNRAPPRWKLVFQLRLLEIQLVSVGE